MNSETEFVPKKQYAEQEKSNRKNASIDKNCSCGICHSQHLGSRTEGLLLCDSPLGASIISGMEYIISSQHHLPSPDDRPRRYYRQQVSPRHGAASSNSTTSFSSITPSSSGLVTTVHHSNSRQPQSTSLGNNNSNRSSPFFKGFFPISNDDDSPVVALGTSPIFVHALRRPPCSPHLFCFFPSRLLSSTLPNSVSNNHCR